MPLRFEADCGVRNRQRSKRRTGREVESVAVPGFEGHASNHAASMVDRWSANALTVLDAAADASGTVPSGRSADLRLLSAT